MGWGEGTIDHCPELSGYCGDRLSELSARWGRPLHHVIHTIALTVLVRQAVDGAAHLHTGGIDRGRVVFPPDLALSEAVRIVGDLVGDATAILVTNSNGDSGLPERVRLEVLAREDGTLAVRTTCAERQAARLTHAWHHPYEPTATARDVPLVCPADAEDLRRWELLAPIPATTLDATFARIAQAVPARTAVAAGGYRLTYGLTGELCAEGSALPCATLPPTGAAPKSAEPLLGSGRLGRLRMDGLLELAEVPAARPRPAAPRPPDNRPAHHGPYSPLGAVQR